MASDVELFSRAVAAFNAAATVALLVGYVRIRAGDRPGHGKAMAVAFLLSALFLAVYLASKANLILRHDRQNVAYAPEVGSVWASLGWLYYLILIPHILLAIVVTPFVIRAVWLAAKGRFEEHKRLTRWVFPVWVYVSVTGILVWVFMEFSGSLAKVVPAVG
jgi:putative membrane protein